MKSFIYIPIAIVVACLSVAAYPAIDISQTQFFKPRVSLYSEAYHLTGPDISGTASKLKVKMGPREVFGYVAMGNDLMSEPKTPHQLQTFSYQYIAPGLGVSLKLSHFGNVTGLVEARAVKRIDPKQDNDVDYRSTLTYGYLWHQGGSFLSSQTSFAEVYAETIHSTLLDDNVIASGFIRSGYRFGWQGRWFQDSFLEVFSSRDSQKLNYNNVAELRPSLRLSYLTGYLGIALTANLVKSHFYDVGVSPPEGRQGWSTRFLMVLSANS